MKKKFLLLINLVALLFAWQISHIKQVSADDKIDVVTSHFMRTTHWQDFSGEVRFFCFSKTMYPRSNGMKNRKRGSAIWEAALLESI